MQTCKVTIWLEKELPLLTNKSQILFSGVGTQPGLKDSEYWPEAQQVAKDDIFHFSNSLHY